MTRPFNKREAQLWHALSELHTYCIGKLEPPFEDEGYDGVMAKAQAALKLAGKRAETPATLISSLTWHWGPSTDAKASTLEWLAYKRERGVVFAAPKMTLQKGLDHFRDMSESTYCHAISEAIRMNWEGFFKPKAMAKKGGLTAEDLMRGGE